MNRRASTPNGINYRKIIGVEREVTKNGNAVWTCHFEKGGQTWVFASDLTWLMASSGKATSISFLAAGKVSPQGLVFKAMIIKVECVAVFADSAHGGVVETGGAIASYFQRDC